MKFIIDFQEKKEKLKQELNTLLCTKAGSVPVFRDYGISWKCLDNPPEVAESLFHQELLKKTEQYIPDIQIYSVDFVHDAENGEMYARITCGRRDNLE